MRLTIYPGQPLHGTLHLPGDKSLSHRAALFAALAQGESRIANFLDAGVTRVMLQALGELGIPWELDEKHTLTIHGRGLTGFTKPTRALDCGNSATTLRLLTGAVAAAGIRATLDGSPGLRRRPMRRIVEPLQQMGVPIVATPEWTAPLVLSARPPSQKLFGMRHTLQVASAQVKSCLLLAGLAADMPVEVLEPAASRDHSERMLRRMGAVIETYTLPGMDPKEPNPALSRIMPLEKDLQSLQLSLPGDISSAAFFIVAALITPGSDLVIENVLLNPGRTGLIDVLQGMGAELQVDNEIQNDWEPRGNLRIRHSSLRAAKVSGEVVVRMIDEFPAFAVAAAVAKGTTQVRQAGELRAKESDRIKSLTQLARLGAEIHEQAEGFDVLGQSQLAGGEVDALGDHRIAMALAVAGLAAKTPVSITGAEIIHESFPGFTAALQALGAHLEVSQ